MTSINLNREMNNKLTIVNLPKITLYFSYETIIAFVYCYSKRQRLYINKDYLDYSRTTSKHFKRIEQLTNLKPINRTSKQLDDLLNFVFRFPV